MIMRTCVDVGVVAATVAAAARSNKADGYNGSTLT